MDKITHEDKLISRDVNEVDYYGSDHESEVSHENKIQIAEFSSNVTKSTITLDRHPDQILTNGFQIKIIRNMPKTKPGIYILHCKLVDIFSQPYLNLNLMFRIRNLENDLSYEDYVVKEGRNEWFKYSRDAVLTNSLDYERIAKNVVDKENQILKEKSGASVGSKIFI